jgi:putative ABC transport system substrate-binding protein
MGRIGLAVVLTVSLILPPLAAEAQSVAKIPRVGFLAFGRTPSPEDMAKGLFTQAMREVGWVDGQNILIERRYGESDDQLHALAGELVRLKVEVVVVPNSGLAKIVQTESSTVPIVIWASGFDLVTAGFAASLARPGGNVTGTQLLNADLIGKRVQLLKELLPNLARFATLGGSPATKEIDPATRDSYQVAADAAAITMRMQRDRFGVGSPEHFPAAFRAMGEKQDRGLLVWDSPFMWTQRTQIIDLAAKHRIAVIYEHAGYVKAGGLMCYGTNLGALWRRTASQVDKILKGAKPGDVPIEQPTKFELVINLKTAKALGLTIPHSILLRADQVIE